MNNYTNHLITHADFKIFSAPHVTPIARERTQFYPLHRHAFQHSYRTSKEHAIGVSTLLARCNSTCLVHPFQSRTHEKNVRVKSPNDSL